MCWWHMATHWQLGVQVQEQTWVLKSQLAEAKFSACALGASMPGKGCANIVPPCSNAFRPLVDAACQGTTTAIQTESVEQMKRNVKRLSSPPPQPHSQFQARKYSKQHKPLTLLWLLSQRLWDILTKLSLQEQFPCDCDTMHIRAWWSRSCYLHQSP